MISSDMPELIALADRIVVMNGYRIVGGMANDRDYSAMSQAIMARIHRQDVAAPGRSLTAYG